MKHFRVTILGGLLLLGVYIASGYIVSMSERRSLPVLAQIKDFRLIDQGGHPVSLADLRGKVWVADIIFTRCAFQCLIMSAHMKALQTDLASEPDVKLVSLTTDPVYDTPTVLQKYGERFNAKPDRWLFLTGEKSVMAAVAQNLQLTSIPTTEADRQGPDDLFVHSTKLVLIDQQGRIRAYFNGESNSDRPTIIEAAKTLLKEK